MKKFFKSNSLSIVFLILFLIAFVGQIWSGLKVYNEELQEAGQPIINLSAYLSSGHFISSTFENWESEFLQMAFFVVLTIFLCQKGSSESKDPDCENECDREPDPKKKDAPWPVRQGGWIMQVYKHSLTIALLVLFLASFVLHFYGSWKNENHELMEKGQAVISKSDYFCEAQFWFESMQNWQSEFLSVFAIVLLSVYLRQIGSPQSKPVDANSHETESS